MLVLTINSINKSALFGTFSLSDNINARSTLSFTLDTDDLITVGQEVIATDNGIRIFGGTIENFRKTYLQGSGGSSSRRRYLIECIDFNQILDRRMVAETYVDKTVNFIINDVVANFLDGEDITVGTITNGDTVIKQAVFNYISAYDTFRYIQDISGLNFNIDYFKELTFFKREDSIGLPFDDSNCLYIEVEETRQQYRNNQLLRAGDGTTEVQVDEIPTPKPDGKSKQFRTRFPLASKPTNIKINGSPILDSDIGVNGVDKDKKWYWSKGSNDLNQSNTEVTLLETDTLTFSYKGLKPIMIQAQNIEEQENRSIIEGGSGIYQSIENMTQLDSKETALEYAKGLLVKYGEIPRNITINCETTRRAGDIVIVTSDNLEVSEDFLITNVSAFEVAPHQLRYSIKGASGEDFGDWTEFFRNLKAGGEISIRENEVLVKLKTVIEKVGVVGTTTIKKFKALYPSDTLVPSNTLVPNNTVFSEVIKND